MATSNKAAWQNIQSKLMAMGYGESVVIGEPRHKMQSGTIALIPIEGDVDSTVLDAPRELHRMNMRMYVNWLEQEQEETEFLLDKFRADILEDIFGNFELGGNVAYIKPAETTWTYDEDEVENTLYRVINIGIVYRFDANASFVA